MNRKNARIIMAGAGFSAVFFATRKKTQPALWSAAVALAAYWMMPSKYRFSRKAVVITGGSRGLGLALGKAFLEKGSRVALLARDEEELFRAEHLLKEEFGSDIEKDVLTVVCDITKQEELQAAVDAIQKKFGAIHIFINNAGSILVGPFETYKKEDLEAQMKIHFFAPAQATRMLIPVFKRQKEGRIVNISSLGGKIPVPHLAGYCASKFALSGFSQVMQAELRKDNIHVTTVYPGLMRTGSTSQAVFKGSHEKEFAWFSVLGWTPGIAISPKSAAEKVLKAIENGDTEVVISPLAKIAVFFYNRFTEIFSDVNAMVNRLLPRGMAMKRKTGAQSRGWVQDRVWTMPLRHSIKKMQKRYNQQDHFDAKKNMNL